MPNELLQLFGQVLTSAASALVILATAVASSVVPLTRFLQSARVKNMAVALQTGITDSTLRADVQGRLHRTLLKGLRKGEGFVEEYRDATPLHRLSFLLGSICALAAILVLASLATSELLLPALFDWAAGSVVASSFGLTFFLKDCAANLLAIIAVSISFAILCWAFFYVFTRMCTIWRVHRGSTEVGEPTNLGRYDVVISTIGVVFPVGVILNIGAFMYCKGSYARTLERAREHYEDLVSPNAPEDIASKIGFDSTDESSKHLAIAAVVTEFARSRGTTRAQVDKEARAVANLIHEISPDSARAVLLENFWPHDKRMERLREHLGRVGGPDLFGLSRAAYPEAGFFGAGTDAASALENLESGEMAEFVALMRESYFESADWEQRVRPRFPDYKAGQVLQGTPSEQDELAFWVELNSISLQFDPVRKVYVQNARRS